MPDLAILVPSRGRPVRFRALLDAVAARSSTHPVVYLATDDDDPELEGYLSVIQNHAQAVLHVTGPRRSLSAWTNMLAELALQGEHAPLYLASLGDDHRPRTPQWDNDLMHAIERMEGPGIAYGNDLLQGRKMPTAWVVSSGVVRALGWMMLPACEHMYVDNVTRDLGQAAGRLDYLPGVIVEHEHPLAGKVDWDQSYRESNHRTQYDHDEAAYKAWRTGQMAADALTLVGLKH